MRTATSGMPSLVSLSRGPMRSQMLPTRALNLSSRVSVRPRIDINRIVPIACEGTRHKTWRSLSESGKGSFADIQYQSSLRSLHSSTSSSSESTSPPGALPQDFEQTTDLIENGELIDINMLALKPDLGESGLPPLPPIEDEALRQQVFTHRSFFARSRHDFEDSPNNPAPDNEVMEHLGDAVLQLIVTELIRDCYPTLRVGPATKIRALAVGNATIADISVKYGLPDRIRFHVAQALTLKASTSLQADVFEAYIGGLYKDQGLDAVRNWLNVLFQPYVKEAYRIVRDHHGLPSPPPTPSPSHTTEYNNLTSVPPSSDQNQNGTGPQVAVGHLALFNQYLQQKHMTVEWKFHAVKDDGTKITPIWEVHAIIDNHPTAMGRANTKKGAQNEAAREALVQIGVSDAW